MKITETAVKNPISTALIFIAIVIMGIFSLTKLPIDLYPNMEMNMLMVITTYPGASAEDIETNVTRPLESVLNTVQNLKKLTSNSKENTSVVTLQFEFGKDIDQLTNDVRDKIELIKTALPDGVSTPIIFKFSTDMIPILIISAQAKESLPGLYKILDDGIANRLARIGGVGSVSVTGAPEREILVYVDPDKLAAYNMTIEGISQAIAVANMNMPAGNIDVGSSTYSLRVKGEFTSPKQLDQVVVGTVGDKTIFLKDIAHIKDALQERVQSSFTNEVQGASVMVQKQSGANSVQIADEVKALLPELQKNLPADVELNIIMDTSTNINNTIGSLEETVILAFLFVMIVVLFFLGRWRATIIIIVTIPISLISSFIYLYATGGSLNIISLSGLTIAIGLVVDDAIVVLENITKHIERGSDPHSASIQGTNEVSMAVIASTMTLVAVFLPFTMMGGMAGMMFQVLGWIVTIMIVMSLVAAITLTPMMTTRMLRKNLVHSNFFNVVYGPIERMLNSLDKGYGKVVHWATLHRWSIIGFGVVFFILTLLPLITGKIGSEFIPASDNARIAVTIELPVGTRNEITRDLSLEISKHFREQFPDEIEVINFSTGQPGENNSFALLQNNGSNIASFNIRLVSKNKRAKTQFEISDEMRTYLNDIPDIKKINVVAGGGMSMTGGQQTFDVEVYGYNFEETDAIAAQLSKDLATIPGFTNITISRADYQPEFQVDFDREKLALNGLTLATASTFLRNRMSGAIASLYREDGDEYNIRVIYAPEFRESIADIENILIYNNVGKAVKIRDIGTVVQRFSPPTIERKSRQRVITISGAASGTTLDKVVAGADKIIANMDLPSDISIAYSGSYEDMQESFGDMGLLLVLIVMLVFVVMASQFESLTYPFIIMFTIPFAISGVMLALWITGQTLNIMSIIGIIMLMGIVVKNGIVLVDYINLNRERGMAVRHAVTLGGESRLRPVLMTSITAILGMVPLAMGGGEGAEMWQPMAVAVVGGLTVSTLLTLVFVPAMYTVFAGTGIKRQKRQLEKKNAK
ncbi:MAG: efflux RND transporter permease subunit [Prevotellaceae bacterium]|jgi:HAE1 family hydrophobic/amphiphilic exporter-1|nr:efflux RND transporter permease subunit [Prevotellaceae bacterium]